MPEINPTLLPCPFCGETPHLTKHFKEEMWSLLHRCRVIGPVTIDWSESQTWLAEKWNTRTPGTPKA